MPPPTPAELPVIVLLLTVRMPLPSRASLEMPPPELTKPPVVELPEIVQLLTLRVPRLKIPPPLLSGNELPSTVPPEMVNPEMLTVLPLLTKKIRKLGIGLQVAVAGLAQGLVSPGVHVAPLSEQIPAGRRTVSTFAPGPLMVTSSARLGSALKTKIVPVNPGLKLRVSAPGVALASTMAWRKVPVPAFGAGFTPP